MVYAQRQKHKLAYGDLGHPLFQNLHCKFFRISLFFCGPLVYKILVFIHVYEFVVAVGRWWRGGDIMWWSDGGNGGGGEEMAMVGPRGWCWW